MLLYIHVIPWSKHESFEDFFVDEHGRERKKLKISAKAVDGAANKAVINFLSKHYKIPKSQIKIVKWELGREKTIEILLD